MVVTYPHRAATISRRAVRESQFHHIGIVKVNQKKRGPMAEIAKGLVPPFSTFFSFVIQLLSYYSPLGGRLLLFRWIARSAGGGGNAALEGELGGTFLSSISVELEGGGREESVVDVVVLLVLLVVLVVLVLLVLLVLLVVLVVLVVLVGVDVVVSV